MVHLGDDPRFDLGRHFAANSVVDLKTVCNRLWVRCGERNGLPQFEIDGEEAGDDAWGWGETRSSTLGFGLTVIFRRAESDRWKWMPAEANFSIHFFWNSSALGWKEVRQIQTDLAEALECPLIPLPTKYFA